MEVREEQFGNDEFPTLPIYPIEDGTSYYVVYNNTYEPVEGYIFMGWVIYYAIMKAVTWVWQGRL